VKTRTNLTDLRGGSVTLNYLLCGTVDFSLPLTVLYILTADQRSTFIMYKIDSGRSPMYRCSYHFLKHMFKILNIKKMMVLNMHMFIL